MCSKEGPFMPSNYREMYFHLFRETEKAIRILQEAQAACGRQPWHKGARYGAASTQIP